MRETTTKIILYIGADNKIKRITEDYEKEIENILKGYWNDFTLTRHRGYYEGDVEESISAVIIVLQLVYKDLLRCIKELKVKLVQNTIGCEIVADVDFKLR